MRGTELEIESCVCSDVSSGLGSLGDSDSCDTVMLTTIPGIATERATKRTMPRRILAEFTVDFTPRQGSRKRLAPINHLRPRWSIVCRCYWPILGVRWACECENRGRRPACRIRCRLLLLRGRTNGFLRFQDEVLNVSLRSFCHFDAVSDNHISTVSNVDARSALPANLALRMVASDKLARHCAMMYITSMLF